MKAIKIGAEAPFLLAKSFIAIIYLFAMHIMLPNLGGSSLDLPFNGLTLLALSIFIGTYLLILDPKNLLKINKHSIYISAILITLVIIQIFNGKFDINLVCILLICVLLSLILSTEIEIKNEYLLGLLFIAATFQASIGIMQSLGWNISIHGASIANKLRPVGTFQQPNVLTSFITTGYIIAFLLINKNKLNKAKVSLLIFGSIIITVCTIITASRTGWISLAFCALMTLIVFKDNKLVLKKILLSILASTLISSALFYFSDSNRQIIESKAHTESVRSVLYHQVIDLISEAPLSGFGPNSFERNYVQNTSNLFHKGKIENPPLTGYEHPHNELLHIWVEHGIIPIIAILFLVVLTLKEVARMTKNKRFISLALLFPITLHSILEYPFRHSLPHLITFLILLHIVQSWSGYKSKTIKIGTFVTPLRALGLIIIIVGSAASINSLIMNHALWKIELDPEKNARYLSWPFYPGENNTRYEFVVNGAMYSIGMKNNDKQALSIFTTWAEEQKLETPRINLYHAMINAYMRLEQPDKAIAALKEVAYYFPDKEHPVIAKSSE